MKTKLLLIASLWLVPCSLLFSQFSPLYHANLLSYDTSGVSTFDPGKLHPGEELANLEMALQRTWTDETMDMTHYRYQQTYMGIPIEGAEYIQHVKDGWLVYANGKFVDTVTTALPSGNPLTEQEAYALLLDSLEGRTLAWNDSLWEAQIKEDTGDSIATFQPTGRLIWAMTDPRLVRAHMDGSNHRLAYTFEVLSLVPSSHERYYIDALTGALFRREQLSSSNGPAALLSYGTRTIDTRWAGNLTRHILHTNDAGRAIHTKWYDENKPWSNRPEIRDADDDWSSDDEKATTPHWMVSQAWDMFAGPPYNRAGFDGNGIQVRVDADWVFANAIYARYGLVDYLQFGTALGAYLVSIDICAHEFGHGIDRYTADLEYASEFGALDESFADIYGFMVERYTDGGVTQDWTIGEDAVTLRSMEDPGLFNQPDTYEGDLWAETVNRLDTNDFGGVHTNSGVQNYWFYLLSQGGSGMNDFGTSYAVTGIGVDDAALIAYWTHTNSLVTNSEFIDSRALTIAFARLHFGECSPQHRSTVNAWHAVGIGDPFICTVDQEPAVDSEFGPKVSVHPNPVIDRLSLYSEVQGRYDLEIIDASGRCAYAETNCTGTSRTIVTSGLPDGLYLIRLKNHGKVATSRFVKQH